MKIYFEDGRLLSKSQLDFKYDFFIDAKNGYSFCQERLDIAKRYYRGCTIYTNSLVALDNRYAWNEDLGVSEIFMRDEKTQNFYRIDELTQRELRRPHNIMKMYMANEFRNKVSSAERGA